MSTTFPTFKLYEDDGITLAYQFEKVIDINPPLQHDGIDYVEHNTLRGQGSIIVEGSEEPYDLSLEFILTPVGSTDQEKYISLISQMDLVKSSILTGTKYVLKIDKSLSVTEDTKVKRVVGIEFPLEGNQKIVNYQKVIVTFRANVW